MPPPRDSNTLFLCFPTRQNLVNRKHPTTILSSCPLSRPSGAYPVSVSGAYLVHTYADLAFLLLSEVYEAPQS